MTIPPTVGCFYSKLMLMGVNTSNWNDRYRPIAALYSKFKIRFFSSIFCPMPCHQLIVLYFPDFEPTPIFSKIIQLLLFLLNAPDRKTDVRKDKWINWIAKYQSVRFLPIRKCRVWKFACFQSDK